MGGFFGIVSMEPCANMLFRTDYHSHMGNRRAGMATMGEQGIIKRSIHSIENAYLGISLRMSCMNFKAEGALV